MDGNSPSCLAMAVPKAPLGAPVDPKALKASVTLDYMEIFPSSLILVDPEHRQETDERKKRAL